MRPHPGNRWPRLTTRVAGSPRPSAPRTEQAPRTRPSTASVVKPGGSLFTTAAPPPPTEVIVWHPSELTDFDPDGLHVSSSLSSAAPGTRGVIYCSTRDQGIVGLFDFASSAEKHPDLNWTAYGLPQLLDVPITRAELLADEHLHPVFRHIRGRRGLTPDASARLHELLSSVPARQPTEPLPVGEVWRWVSTRHDTDWPIESAMRDAIRGHRDSWRELGFTARPEKEVRPARAVALRTDLYEVGVIAECKVVMSGLDVLAQIDGYLAHARAEHPDRSWAGHIIVSAGYTQNLRDAVAERPDISLWTCRRKSGQPFLERVR